MLQFLMYFERFFMEMVSKEVLFAILLTLFAGASSAIGALIAFFSYANNTRFLSFGLGFSAGVMIYIAFVEILPSSLLEFDKYYFGFGEIIGLLCFFGGMVLTSLIDRVIPKDLNPHNPKSTNELLELKICPIPSNLKRVPNYHPGITMGETIQLKRTGILTAVAIGVHNFPEGFAVFVSSLESLSFGIVIAIAIAIHNIPEGMAVSLPIYHATGDKKKAFIYSAISGLAEPLGAIVGALLLLPFMGDLTLAITFAFVAGIMVFISLDELLPASKNYGEAHDSLYGLILGMGVMAFSLLILE